jgi:16S rRNA (guanine1207-N2)-methyltransferase
MPLLETPFASLDLIRQPEQQNEPLQAFDAADEYLLNHLAEQQPSTDTGSGAQRQFRCLGSQPGGQGQVTSSGDSFLAFQGLEKNLARNGLPFDGVPHIPASERSRGPSTGC